MKNTMKVCFASLGLLFVAAGAHAFFGQEPNSMVPSGLSFQTVTSSAQIFKGAGVFYGVIQSTGNNVNYGVVFDTLTNLAPGGYAFNSFNTSTQTVTPSLVFWSTASFANSGANPGNGVNYMPYGVSIANGLFWWKSAVSPEAATILYSK